MTKNQTMLLIAAAAGVVLFFRSDAYLKMRLAMLRAKLDAERKNGVTEGERTRRADLNAQIAAIKAELKAG